jgi:DNA polymerase I
MTKSSSKPRHVFLVDGSGFIFRAFHALPPMTRSDGTPVNAVYGFCNMLMKLLRDTDADHIAVIFDSARKTFRNDIYPQYKAQRPPPPDELIPQFQLCRDAVEAFNVPAVDLPGYEADDLIATYTRQAREAGADVTVVSSDKDLMQLVEDKVVLYDAMRNRELGLEAVQEKFGVGPDKVIEVQALAGDSVDNVPGVPGIGVKTAALLITEYGDLENLLAHAGEIKQPKRREALIENADLARISHQLVTLKNDVPVERDIDSFDVRELDADVLTTFLREQGFKTIVARIDSQRTDTGDAPVKTDQPTKVVGKPSYVLVQDEKELEGWVTAACKAGVVAFDTETTSLDAMRADLVGFSLSVEPGAACYVPVAHKAPQTQPSLDLAGEGEADDADAVPQQIALDRALALIKPMLEDPSVLKIGHNIKYDAMVLARYGVEIAAVDDTLVLSHVLDAGLHGHGMDELATLHFDHTNIKFAEVAGSGRKQITFDYVPLDVARDYAAEDADVTLRLHELLKPRLLAEHMVTVYEAVERPLIPVLLAMERAGVLVDPKFLRELSSDFARRLGELEIEIHKLAGEEFNIASPKQLGEILFDKMGISGGKKGKTGAYGTGADILEGLAAEGHDMPARVLDWRQLAKLKSTYTDSLTEQINPDTGRVHTSYSMAGASTGRLSSTDPNLQNIPIRTEEGRKIRQAFIAEKGSRLVSLDYSQIELRVLAHMAEIDALVDAFRNGADIHALTASQVFDLPIEGMDPMTRRRAKAINFGIIYGISPFGLARQLSIPQGEAKAYIEAYFERYPGIRDYMESIRETARKTGYVTTLFGRHVHVAGINERNPAHRGFAERQAINAPIQGSAADIIKRAMIRVPGALDKAQLKATMLLQVHDELLFEVPEAEIDETIDVVSKVMERAAGPSLELSVPLVVDAGVGMNWAEAH